MTPDEAGQLLARCAVFDNRKPSAAAVQGWAVALADVPFDDDALTAVAKFYGSATGHTGQRWIQPHHVRELRAQLRATRIHQANLVYDGRPEETGAQSAASLRALERAAADGRVPAKAISAALNAGTGRPSPRLLTAAANVGREIPPAEQPHIGVNALAVACPHCHVPASQLCRSRRQAKRRDVHPSRLDAANAARTSA
jgi:hypothetical protein